MVLSGTLVQHLVHDLLERALIFLQGLLIFLVEIIKACFMLLENVIGGLVRSWLGTQCSSLSGHPVVQFCEHW